MVSRHTYTDAETTAYLPPMTIMPNSSVHLPERIDKLSICPCCDTLYAVTADGKLYQIRRTRKGKFYSKRRAWNAHLVTLFS